MPADAWAEAMTLPCHNDDPQLRRAVCCDAEPMCVLCPLRPENADRGLAGLKAAGLKARFAEHGL